MIELKHFISQTLIEIVEGVVEAQKAVRAYGATVNPEAARPGFQGSTQEPRTESVNFDIEVTTADSSTSKQGVGVFVAPLAMGKQGVSDTKQTSVGRIQFHVWVELPVSRGATKP